MGGVEIRIATTLDKQAILGIGDDVYDGADYLPDLFDECFINCDHTTPYVAVLNGDIVGFAAATTVDDGRTVVSRAARAIPKFSGKGIYKMLTEHLLKLSRAKVSAFMSYSSNPAISSSSFKKSNNMILSKSLIRYDFHVSTLTMPEEIYQLTDNLIPVSRDTLHYLFTSNPHKDYLFPGDRMLANLLACKALPSNIPLIWMREEHALRVSDVRLDDDGAVTSLMSFSSTWDGPTGVYVYRLFVFGADNSSVRRHIVAHLRCLRDRATGKASITSDPGLDKARIHNVLEEFGLQDSYLESCATFNLYEKMINKE